MLNFSLEYTVRKGVQRSVLEPPFFSTSSLPKCISFLKYLRLNYRLSSASYYHLRLYRSFVEVGTARDSVATAAPASRSTLVLYSARSGGAR